MKLEQYIDLDGQVQFGPPERRFLPVLDREEGRSDEELLKQWMAAEPTSGPSLGGAVHGAFQLALLIVILAGLLAGAGAAAALLRYDGSEPINILVYLAVMVGFQIVLIPLLVLGFLYRRRLGLALRLMQALVGWLVRRLIHAGHSRHAGGRSPEEIEAEWGTLRAKSSLFRRVQAPLLLLLFQVFGVAFNTAALATLIFLVLFSDLAFAWATTLQADAERIHGITSAISAPWATVWPEARPSRELVEATRFARMEGAFVGARDAASVLAGGWWRFLLAATFTYGWLPRAVAAGIAFALYRREMRRALTQNSKVQALLGRLRTPEVQVAAGSPVAVESPEDRGAPEATSPHASLQDNLRLGVVFWAYDRTPPNEVVREVLGGALDIEACFIAEAGNLQSSEQAVLQQLRNGCVDGSADGAAVFFEPFEPPKTDARRFLGDLRQVLGKNAPVLIVLAEFDGDHVIPPEPAERDTWQRAIDAMGDPFMFFRSLSAT